MKRMLCTLLTVLVLTAALPALAAAPTGATPAETAVYTAPGCASAGLPAHADAVLGKPQAAAFMLAPDGAIYLIAENTVIYSPKYSGPDTNVDKYGSIEEAYAGGHPGVSLIDPNNPPTP